MIHKIAFRNLTVKAVFCKTFDVIFNRAHRINRSIIRLVQNGVYTPCAKRPNNRKIDIFNKSKVDFN